MSDERKTTCLYLDPEILFIAQEKCKEIYGSRRMISRIVNDFLTEFVTDGEMIDRPDPIKQKARELANKKLREIREQQKIISNSEASKLEAEEYRQKRGNAVENAAIRVFLKYRNFSRCLPENDPDFDHVDEFDHAVSEISRLAGYDVDPAEVIRIYHEKTRTRYTGSKEVEALADGIPFCEDDLSESQAIDLYRRSLS